MARKNSGLKRMCLKTSIWHFACSSRAISSAGLHTPRVVSRRVYRLPATTSSTDGKSTHMVGLTTAPNDRIFSYPLARLLRAHLQPAPPMVLQGPHQLSTAQFLVVEFTPPLQDLDDVLHVQLLWDCCLLHSWAAQLHFARL